MRVNIGSAEIPIISFNSSFIIFSISLSSRETRSSLREPPIKHLIKTESSGDLYENFLDTHDAPIILLFSTLGTRNPNPFIGWDILSFLYANDIVAVETYGIVINWSDMELLSTLNNLPVS